MKVVTKILKNKIFIISVITIFVIVSLFVGTYFVFKSSFKLNGDDEVFISYKEKYKEKKASIINKSLSKKIKIKSNVKDGKLGNYKVEYTFNYFFLKLKKVRKVHVVDKDLPILKLVGDDYITMCPGKTYEEQGYEATDEYDGNLTDKVIVSDSQDKIIYEVEDSSHNKVRATRIVVREDKINPEISLNGSSTIYVRNGSHYYESGANVSDNCDEDINYVIEGTVNTTQDGTYTLTYKATDLAGNESSVQRKVIVYTDNRVGVVYLTFDDGPSGTGTTEQILNILRDEGVKATFFVTGSGPDGLIKREYSEGHAIGLHTYTHEYSQIYSSVSNYYDDLNKVKARVHNLTGLNPTITRFPGGSNNTVSNNYSYGIMDTLTKDVVNNGYSYFDWNVAGNDAGGCYDSGCVYRSIVNDLSKDRVNIVLMHDSKWHTANALKDIITYCKENGFVFEVLTSSTKPIRFK